MVTGFLAPISKSVRIVGCGGRIWTYDLRVMSPTSCQTALLRDIVFYTTLVPVTGVEPVRELNSHGILSPGRLPIPPHRHFWLPVYYTTTHIFCQYFFINIIFLRPHASIIRYAFRNIHFQLQNFFQLRSIPHNSPILKFIYPLIPLPYGT